MPPDEVFKAGSSNNIAPNPARRLLNIGIGVVIYLNSLDIGEIK
jgi:hypothetical protein